MRPRTLDHVALWVADRERMAATRHRAARLARDRADRPFTLLGADARRGKLTLFDAEGPRERGRARPDRAARVLAALERCRDAGGRPRAEGLEILLVEAETDVESTSTTSRWSPRSGGGRRAGTSARLRAARGDGRRASRSAAPSSSSARATRASRSGRCSTTSPCSSTRPRSTGGGGGPRHRDRGARRRAEHVRASSSGGRTASSSSTSSTSRHSADLMRRRRRHGRPRRGGAWRGSSASTPAVLEKGDRPGGSMLLSSCVIWRYRTLDASARSARTAIPAAGLIVERLDDALDWLESLGAEPVLAGDGQPAHGRATLRPGAAHATRSLAPPATCGCGTPFREREQPLVLATGGFARAAAHASARPAPAREPVERRRRAAIGLERGAAAIGGMDEFYGRACPAAGRPRSASCALRSSTARYARVLRRRGRDLPREVVVVARATSSRRSPGADGVVRRRRAGAARAGAGADGRRPGRGGARGRWRRAPAEQLPFALAASPEPSSRPSWRCACTRA